MGSMMAANLGSYAEKNSLPRVRIWNRTRSKIEHIPAESYCAIDDTLPELVQSCDVIHTCLANDEVALSIYDQLFAAKGASIFVDHSTLFPTTSQALHEKAKGAGRHYLSCPVFGPPAAAKSAGLLVAISGDLDAQQVVKQYIVPTLGKATIDCGEDPTKGAMLKILGNNCILGTIELLSESFTLAEKTGFDVDLFYQFIRTRFYSPS
jgi:3-hydroxyisobutyrate dehydrogenase-like beta-hydroxyacid dehydrogenase